MINPFYFMGLLCNFLTGNIHGIKASFDTTQALTLFAKSMKLIKVVGYWNVMKVYVDFSNLFCGQKN
ncbi:MAG: hypothetical protein DU480_08575 [Nitrosomonas sp.]|uniref:hypothetical protein n=1 Tax=Nitrosomonas sp. TaxID=42353 RepID=UPI0032EC0E96